MRVDLYTKIVLTIIAVWLVVVVLGTNGTTPLARAQETAAAHSDVGRFQLCAGVYKIAGYTASEDLFSDDTPGVFKVDTANGRTWLYHEWSDGRRGQEYTREAWVEITGERHDKQ